MTKIATAAQARELAFLFATDRDSHIGGYTSPTASVLVREKWISSTGKSGVYPNGERYDIYKINDAGLEALEGYLRSYREKRIAKK